MHITLKLLCGLGERKIKVGEMASKAANVSLHSVRNGEVPAEDAAQGLEKNFLFEHWWEKNKT